VAELGFDEAFREGGGRRRWEPVPYPLTFEDVRRMAEKRERLLRIQFEDETFDPEDEATLARLSLDNPDQCFVRFRLLCGMWHAWEKGMQRHETSAEDHLTAHLLITCEPTTVTVAGREVEVFPPSRSKMIRMARHERRRRELGHVLDRAEELHRERKLPHRWRNAIRRAEDEWEFQFRGILANALGREGRAYLPDEAPPYWAHVSEDDESRIIVALMLPAQRLASLPALPPDPRTKSEAHPPPEFGYDSVLAQWEPRLNLPPAALNDAPLAPFLAWVRAGASTGAEAKEAERAFAA